ncbi:hypothetical protein PC129_g23240, partial [Phytophthora cactorum]
RISLWAKTLESNALHRLY